MQRAGGWAKGESHQGCCVHSPSLVDLGTIFAPARTPPSVWFAACWELGRQRTLSRRSAFNRPSRSARTRRRGRCGTDSDRRSCVPDVRAAHRARLVGDLRLAWERPCDPARLTPHRVRRGFRQLRAALGTPAGPPESTTPGPGRPKGTRRPPRPRDAAIMRAALPTSPTPFDPPGSASAWPDRAEGDGGPTKQAVHDSTVTAGVASSPPAQPDLPASSSPCSVPPARCLRRGSPDRLDAGRRGSRTTDGHENRTPCHTGRSISGRSKRCPPSADLFFW